MLQIFLYGFLSVKELVQWNITVCVGVDEAFPVFLVLIVRNLFNALAFAVNDPYLTLFQSCYSSYELPQFFIGIAAVITTNGGR